MESVVEGGNTNRLEAEQTPPLLDPYLKEVSEVKLEIHRIHNRVGFIKGFYHHLRSSQNTEIRRELEDKVNAEADNIAVSINKVVEALERWKPILQSTSGLQKIQRMDLEKGVRSYLKEVLSDYESQLVEHRDLSLTELQIMLKVTTRDSSLEKGTAFIIQQSNMSQILADKHIEIEARYGELLRTDRNLRYLKTKYSKYFTTEAHVDLAVLHLAKLMENQPTYEMQQRKTNKFLVLLMASLSTCCLILLACLFFL